MKLALLLLLSPFAHAADAPADNSQLIAQVKAAPSEADLRQMNAVALTANAVSGRARTEIQHAWYNSREAAKKLGAQGALSDLQALSVDESPSVAAAAIEGLSVATSSLAVVAILRPAILRGGRPRDEALDVLDKQGPAAAAALPELLTLVAEPNANPTLALRCLQTLGPAATSAVPAVSRLLRPKGIYLNEVAQTLAKLGHPGAHALARAMNSKNQEVRQAAYLAGKELDDPEAKAAARKIDGSHPVKPL